MKSLTRLATVIVLTLLTMNAQAVLPLETGPAVFKLTATAQEYSYVTASSRTNHTATATNITTVTKSKATNAPIHADFILGLLANSFNTSFPAGAQLVMRGLGNFSFFVVDSTGTNILLNVSAVLSITENAGVNSGMETLIQKTTAAGTKYSGNNTQVLTEYATLSYNDTALMTKDGTHTNFQLNGILVDSLSTNIGTVKSRQSVLFQGSGSGTIQGKDNIILKGTLSGALSGLLEA
jgi:hypothetical protein